VGEPNAAGRRSDRTGARHAVALKYVF